MRVHFCGQVAQWIAFEVVHWCWNPAKIIAITIFILPVSALFLALVSFVIFLISRALIEMKSRMLKSNLQKRIVFRNIFYREHMLQRAITVCPVGGPSGVAGAHAAPQRRQSSGVAAHRKPWLPVPAFFGSYSDVYLPKNMHATHVPAGQVRAQVMSDSRSRQVASSSFKASR